MAKKKPPQAIEFPAALELTKGAGAEMLASAVQSQAAKRNAKVQKQIEILIERIECLLPIQRNTEMRLELTRKQLAAIHAGAFEVNPLNLHIRFQDEKLNVAWDDTAFWGASDPNEKHDAFRGF